MRSMNMFVAPRRWTETHPIVDLLDLFFPPHCAICGELGAWLCDACVEEIRGQMGVAGLRDAVPAVAALGAVTPHWGVARKVVHQLKYGGMRVLAMPMAALMAEACPQLVNEANLIAPVPLHERRIRRRGYNQSMLLAAALSEQSGIPFRQYLLARTRDTRSQVGLSRTQRLVNVGGAFTVNGTLHGEHVLLIDDVCTTGATLSACAVALAEAGAGRVTALTFARAVGKARNVDL